MARPLKDITEEQVFELARINCSYAEMAAVLDCDESTLTKRFSQVIQKGRASMKESLKRTQYKLAVEKENVTMNIWLGKQHLGQTDKIETKNENRNTEQVEELAKQLLEAKGCSEGIK